MAHVIQCRLCKNRFDAEKEPFVLVGKKSYYHKECYDDWVAGRNNANTKGDEDFWKESVIDYLYRDIKMTIDFSKFFGQWKHFTRPEKKMTPKGVYFALRYFYEVKHGDPAAAQGGIGIVPNVYSDAAQYWTDLETRRAGTIDAIIQQIQARKERKTEIINRTEEPKKEKSKWSLENV